jgi:hypothetical protein
MPRSPCSRKWCWTINKRDEDGDDDSFVATVVQGTMRSLQGAVESGVVRYWIFQSERGNESGLLHLQGYLALRGPQRRPAVKRLLDCEWAHVEPRSPASTDEQAIRYCRKEEGRVEGPWEGGTPPRGQGERTDLKAVKAALDRGDSELSIADGHFEEWVRFHAAFARYRALRCAEQQRQPPDVRAYVGPTGVGKSRSAWERFPHLFPVPLSGRGKSDWFDGYIGQRVVLIDDFLGDEYDVGFFLKLTDRYKMQVPVKGGFFPWIPEVIIITSNLHPDCWFGNARKESREAVMRRISVIKTWSAPGVFEIEKGSEEPVEQ